MVSDNYHSPFLFYEFFANFASSLRPLRLKLVLGFINAETISFFMWQNQKVLLS